MKKKLWYYKNNSFEARREFAAELTPDTIFVPLCVHVGSQNLPKSLLGAVLGRLGAVLERLRGVWAASGNRPGRLGGARRPKGASPQALKAPENRS